MASRALTAVAVAALAATAKMQSLTAPAVEASGGDVIIKVPEGQRVLIQYVGNNGGTREVDIGALNDLANLNSDAIGELTLLVNSVFATKAETMANISTAIADAMSQLRTESSDMASRIDGELSRLVAADGTLCSAACVNGACNNNNVCVCDQGFSGPTCEIGPPTSTPTTTSPTSAPTTNGISSCNEVVRSGVYLFRGGFRAYCDVGRTMKWMKIVQWNDKYTISRDAVNVNACMQGTWGEQACKLSDDNINSITNGFRFYRLRNVISGESIYIYTSGMYDDTANSFNIAPRSARGIVTAEEFDMHDVRTGTTFSRHWIDFNYVSTTEHYNNEECNRYFMGHGQIDCWSRSYNEFLGQRCIRGGAACNNYGIVNGWTMWLGVDPNQ